jgi:hypothetical protein
MPSSELDEKAKAEVNIINNILKKLPHEINGGIVAALLVNILYRYGMEEEWQKIVEAVDDTMEDIDSAPIIGIREVRMN